MNRREIVQGSVSALIMAFLASVKIDMMTESDEGIAEPEPFNVSDYEFIISAMMVHAGVRSSEGKEGVSRAFWDHFYGDAPLPEEYEPYRARCRDGLLAVLKRLDA